MLASAVWKRTGIFEYPFLAGFAWASFFVPQFWGLLLNPSNLPPDVYANGGISRSLLMTCMCAAAGWAGYSFYVRQPAKNLRAKKVADFVLLTVGAIFIIAAYVATFKLASIVGGLKTWFSSEGAYTIEFAGLPVVYNFFRLLIFPGLLFVAIPCFTRPNLNRCVLLAIGALLPLSYVIFLGRRSEAFMLCAVVAMAAHFVRGWTPPRWLSLSLVPIGFAAMLLAPHYRAHSQLGGNAEELLDIDVPNVIEDAFSGSNPAEVTSATVRIYANTEYGIYGYGAGFVRALVSQMIPKSLIGEQGKARLLVRFGKHDLNLMALYGYRIGTGQFITGPASAYMEFWFFGAAVFFLIGRGARILWKRAQAGNQLAQVLYVLLAYYFFSTIVGGVHRIAPVAVLLLIYSAPLLVFARVRAGPRRGMRHQSPQHQKLSFK